MMHSLNLTTAAASIASQLIGIPGTFETPSDVVTASAILDKLTGPLPEKITQENASTMLAPIECSERERDLLKTVCVKHTKHLPPGKHAVCLLQALGFVD